MKQLSTRRLVVGAVLAGVAATLLVATPAAAVTGLSVVSATSYEDLGGFKQALAYCPRGTKVIGGGGNVTGGGDSIHLYSLTPEQNGSLADYFWAGAVQHTSYAEQWSLTAYAICASGVTGHLIVETMGTSPPETQSGATTAYCPAGKKVIGAGGLVYKSASVLDSVIISATLTHVTVESFKTEYHSPYTTAVHAYAICVDPVAGMQRVTASSGYTSSNKVVTVGCPAGTSLHGTGGSLTGAGGQAFMEALAPWGTYGAIFAAREDTTGYAGTWNAEVYAICAP